MTTHFMEEAEYCDHILIQDGGIRLALGTPSEIRAQAGSDSATMEDAFIAIGDTQIMAGDHVAIFAVPESIKSLDKLFR